MHSQELLQGRAEVRRCLQQHASSRVLAHLCNRRSSQKTWQRCLHALTCVQRPSHARGPAVAVAAWWRLILRPAALRSGPGATVCPVHEPCC